MYAAIIVYASMYSLWFRANTECDSIVNRDANTNAGGEFSVYSKVYWAILMCPPSLRCLVDGPVRQSPHNRGLLYTWLTQPRWYTHVGVLRGHSFSIVRCTKLHVSSVECNDWKIKVMPCKRLHSWWKEDMGVHNLKASPITTNKLGSGRRSMGISTAADRDIPVPPPQ